MTIYTISNEEDGSISNFLEGDIKKIIHSPGPKGIKFGSSGATWKLVTHDGDEHAAIDIVKMEIGEYGVPQTGIVIDDSDPLYRKITPTDLEELDKLFYPRQLGISKIKIVEIINSMGSVSKEDGAIDINHPKLTDYFCQKIADAWAPHEYSPDCMGELWQDEDTLDEDWEAILFNTFFN